jgi:hypothetical protein
MLFFRNSRNPEKALDRVLRKAAQKPFEPPTEYYIEK